MKITALPAILAVVLSASAAFAEKTLLRRGLTDDSHELYIDEGAALSPSVDDTADDAHDEKTSELIADLVAREGERESLIVFDATFPTHRPFTVSAMCEHMDVDLDGGVPGHAVLCTGMMPEGAKCPSLRDGIVIHQCDGMRSWLKREADERGGDEHFLNQMSNYNCEPPNKHEVAVYTEPNGDLENGYTLDCKFKVYVASVKEAVATEGI